MKTTPVYPTDVILKLNRLLNYSLFYYSAQQKFDSIQNKTEIVAHRFTIQWENLNDICRTTYELT